MANSLITGTGIYTPKNKISNKELVDSFNLYVDLFNKNNEEKINQGNINKLEYSSEEFIEKASGIKSRYVIEKEGILNPERMRPYSLERSENEPSVQCEMAIKAAEIAIEKAQIEPKDIDAIIMACSNSTRAYPNTAVEIQHYLGTNPSGYAYDLIAACSSAAFGIEDANNAILSKKCNTALVVSPEICSAQLNFMDRDCHFIFGDAASAVIIQNEKVAKTNNSFKILDTKIKSIFSNNIRNDFGFLSLTNPDKIFEHNNLFKQEGRKVFKEVIPAVISHILEQLETNKIQPNDLTRMWLHQANSNMNRIIATKIFGTENRLKDAPTILDEYANTSSAGSIIAFDKYNNDLKPGDLGVICAFGAGYTIGSALVQKI